MKKIHPSVWFGIIAGILSSIAWYSFAKTWGFYEIKVYVYRNYTTLLILLIGVFSSIFYSKRKNKGFLEFKHALKAGMIYSLFLALIVSLFNFIYYQFITPDTIDYFVNEAKNAMVTDKVKPEDFQKYMDSVKANYGSFRLIPPILFWGLILSLLGAASMQKKDPHSFSAN